MNKISKLILGTIITTTSGNTNSLSINDLNNTINVGFENQRNSKYDRNIKKIEINTKTKIGKILISLKEDSGLGRINSNDNIFGLTNFTENPWLKFKGREYKIGYGLKFNPNENQKIYLGFGYGNYYGKTENQNPGDKKLKINGGKIFLKWITDNFQFTTKYSKKNFDIKVYNSISISPLPLIQDTDIKNEKLLIKIENEFGKIKLEQNKIKNIDIFNNPLFPRNELNSKKNIYTIIKKIKLSKNLNLEIGPKYTNGTFANSFTKMKIENKISGLEFKINKENYEIKGSYNSFFANGSNSYLIGEEPLSESIKIKNANLSFGSIKNKTNLENNYNWKTSISYYSENQIGNISSTNPILIFITGGNQHTNIKKVERINFKIEKSINKKLTLKTIYELEKIKGQIYKNNPLYEKSNSIKFDITYKY